MTDEPSATPTAEAEPVEPPSDYIALQSFDELALSPEVRRAIADKGYTKPTPVQATVVAPILAGHDVIVRSKTGTGKTAAFGIPLVEKIPAGAREVRALILCNTRELALQVAEEIVGLAAHKDLRVVAIYGGASMDKQLEALKNGAEIVVGTPGRIQDHIDRRTLKLATCQAVVLDEADEMLNAGFFEDVTRILEALPKDRQTMLFSATVPPDIERIIRRYLREPQTFLLSGDHYTVEGIRNIIYKTVEEYPKPRNLLYLIEYENPENAIIFCNTRSDTGLVHKVLQKNGLDTEMLNGELAQKERERVMAKVKRGEVRFMVATDIAARGIDISDLTHVINYSLPEDPAVYLHRVGRTGRIGKTGTAVSLVDSGDFMSLSALQKKFGIVFEEKKLPTEEEARALWTNHHTAELREAMKSGMAFESFLPLAEDLGGKQDGKLLMAYALKYFFTHHRMEKKRALMTVEETRVVVEQAHEQKEKRREHGRERKPRRDEPRRDEPRRDEPRRESAAVATDAAPSSGPKNVKLYVNLGEEDGLDSAAIGAALAELAGAPTDAVKSVERRLRNSFVYIAPESEAQFIAAHGKARGAKTLQVEKARRQ